jgi:hypothetical protein
LGFYAAQDGSSAATFRDNIGTVLRGQGVQGEEEDEEEDDDDDEDEDDDD